MTKVSEGLSKKLVNLCESFNKLTVEHEKEIDLFCLNNASTFFSTSIYWLERGALQKDKLKKD